MFILKLTIYNNVTEGDNHSDKLCVDASVKVQIGCVRGVFLMRFVNDLLVNQILENNKTKCKKSIDFKTTAFVKENDKASPKMCTLFMNQLYSLILIICLSVNWKHFYWNIMETKRNTVPPNF